MLRPKLRDKYLTGKTNEARPKYRKQRSICVHLLRRAKINYCNSLDLSNVTIDRKFWKMIRLRYDNKIKFKNKITHAEDSPSVKYDQKGANILKSFFVNAASYLKIYYNKSLLQNRDILEIVKS